jgi:hypothetical protein
MEEMNLSLYERTEIKLLLIWKIIKGNGVMYRMTTTRTEGGHQINIKEGDAVCECVFGLSN